LLLCSILHFLLLLLQIGAAQGVAQMLCQFSKGVAGVAGDIMDCQVCVLLAGTFVTLACKAMFAALGTVNAVAGVGATVVWFMATRFLDRMAKGLRDAPAKAITNDLAKRSGDAPDAAYGELSCKKVSYELSCKKS
jgi:hypothetical protein